MLDSDFLEELKTLNLIQEPGVLYSNIKILEFNSLHPNGSERKFRDEQKTKFKVAFFNAITIKNQKRIFDHIELYNSNPNFDLKREILDSCLWKCIIEPSKDYNDWRVGDIGDLYCEYDKKINDLKVKSFNNRTFNFERKIKLKTKNM